MKAFVEFFCSWLKKDIGEKPFHLVLDQNSKSRFYQFLRFIGKNSAKKKEKNSKTDICEKKKKRAFDLNGRPRVVLAAEQQMMEEGSEYLKNFICELLKKIGLKEAIFGSNNRQCIEQLLFCEPLEKEKFTMSVSCYSSHEEQSNIDIFQFG